MDQWIRTHWFELITLVLLCVNLWFVWKVLKVLRAASEMLILLAGWLDRARSDDVARGLPTRPERFLSPTWSVVVIGSLLALSWAVLIAIIMAAWQVF